MLIAPIKPPGLSVATLGFYSQFIILIGQVCFATIDLGPDMKK